MPPYACAFVFTLENQMFVRGFERCGRTPKGDCLSLHRPDCQCPRYRHTEDCFQPFQHSNPFFALSFLSDQSWCRAVVQFPTVGRFGYKKSTSRPGGVRCLLIYGLFLLVLRAIRVLPENFKRFFKRIHGAHYLSRTKVIGVTFDCKRGFYAMLAIPTDNIFRANALYRHRLHKIRYVFFAHPVRSSPRFKLMLTDNFYIYVPAFISIIALYAANVKDFVLCTMQHQQFCNIRYLQSLPKPESAAMAVDVNV